jgi:MoxR-like ATPase
MGERQISVGNETRALPPLFLVMATQNPIEQEGTYPLPEAQLDRFLLHVMVDYPDGDAEKQILRLVRDEQRSKHAAPASGHPSISQADIFAARAKVLDLHMEPVVEQYIVDLVVLSRNPGALDEALAGWISFGASPRGTIALDLAARCHAYLAGKDFVSPDDVQAIAHDALRHRIMLSFEAEAQGVTADQAVSRLIELVATV